MAYYFKNYEIETNHPEYDSCPLDYYGNARFVALALLAAGFTAKIIRREHYADGSLQKSSMGAISEKAIKAFKIQASKERSHLFDLLNIPGFYEKHFAKKEQ